MIEGSIVAGAIGVVIAGIFMGVKFLLIPLIKTTAAHIIGHLTSTWLGRFIKSRRKTPPPQVEKDEDQSK